jgi:hypothetical protein
VNREILSAVKGLGDSMATRIGVTEKTNAVHEYRLAAIDDKIHGRNIGRASAGAE